MGTLEKPYFENILLKCYEEINDFLSNITHKYGKIKKWFLNNYKEIYVTEIETIKIDKEKVA